MSQANPLSLQDCSWLWFKGNEVSAKLLQSIGVFRSHVLYDLGLRKNFAPLEPDFGDLHYVDFESYHFIATFNGKILGSVRVTPPHLETVALSVLGMTDYLKMLNGIGASLDTVLEINRLMVDLRFRHLALGRTLMYAAIALIEKLWDRRQLTIIGSAGNCTKQKEFFLKYTDYETLPAQQDRYSDVFKDNVSFLQYKQPPYQKGAEWIDFFSNHFWKFQSPSDKTLTSYYEAASQATPLIKSSSVQKEFGTLERDI